MRKIWSAILVVAFVVVGAATPAGATIHLTPDSLAYSDVWIAIDTINSVSQVNGAIGTSIADLRACRSIVYEGFLTLATWNAGAQVQVFLDFYADANGTTALSSTTLSTRDDYADTGAAGGGGSAGTIYMEVVIVPGGTGRNLAAGFSGGGSSRITGRGIPPFGRMRQAVAGTFTSLAQTGTLWCLR